jgi:two-component system cell cycle response regulator DivK
MSSRNITGARSRQRVRRPRVVIVDEDADSRESYVAYLRSVGFAAFEASDGEDALEIARTQRPAVIVLDVLLPRMTGLEVTKILKADPLTRDIVVMALTAHVEMERREEAKRVGCDLFIAKPCSPQDLVVQILRMLDIKMSSTR